MWAHCPERQGLVRRMDACGNQPPPHVSAVRSPKQVDAAKDDVAKPKGSSDAREFARVRKELAAIKTSQSQASGQPASQAAAEGWSAKGQSIAALERSAPGFASSSQPMIRSWLLLLPKSMLPVRRATRTSPSGSAFAMQSGPGGDRRGAARRGETNLKPPKPSCMRYGLKLSPKSRARSQFDSRLSSACSNNTSQATAQRWRSWRDSANVQRKSLPKPQLPRLEMLRLLPLPMVLRISLTWMSPKWSDRLQSAVGPWQLPKSAWSKQSGQGLKPTESRVAASWLRLSKAAMLPSVALFTKVQYLPCPRLQVLSLTSRNVYGGRCAARVARAPARAR